MKNPSYTARDEEQMRLLSNERGELMEYQDGGGVSIRWSTCSFTSEILFSSPVVGTLKRHEAAILVGVNCKLSVIRWVVNSEVLFVHDLFASGEGTRHFPQ